MKGLKLLFAVCLAPLAFGAAGADDAADYVRAATRRGVGTTSASAQPSTRTRPSESTSGGNAIHQRGVVTSAGGDAGTHNRATTTRTNAQSRTPERQTGTSSGANVIPRQSAASSAKGTQTPTRVQRSVSNNRTPTSNTARVATTSRAAITGSHSVPTTTSAAAPSRASSKTISRAAMSQSAISGNYKKCREVYYTCMDEFCATKDNNLGRCACSARVNEFNNIKKNLSDIEDKMLTFNQRLLAVNMDAADVKAMTTATEGENAFNQADKSASQRALDDIAKKLNTTFNDSTFNRGLQAISLSLDSDSAFDNIDSMYGSSITAKSDTALYTAALPVCRDMAMEVCTQDEFDLAQAGYQVTIEQDCTTVRKSYQAQTAAAHDTIRESGALLDMSRLDAYQKRNSDDILTCKRKMLTKLTDSSLCGPDMSYCLDITGQYIDPTTGQAFLTRNLPELNNLLTRPTDGKTWASVPENATFITYLNDKKTYLESASDNCQDIFPTVWDEFIEDALAQIKLAQETKLEDMRQSCTTLTTQCMTDAEKSLSSFDARALSIFGIGTDKTASAMCAQITDACTALTNKNSEEPSNWTQGITEIGNIKTYESILQTCREVGRNCITQVCTSSSDKFGMCINTETSVPRKSILNRDACWSDVYNCVASAGETKLAAIKQQLSLDSTYIYKDIYGIVPTNKESPCNGTDDVTCLITEQIWGNCEYNPRATTKTNQIIAPKSDKTTLLYWLAQMTGTQDNQKNCIDAQCPVGQRYGWKNNQNAPKEYICTSSSNLSITGQICQNIYQVAQNIYNCTESGNTDSWDNHATTDQASTEINTNTPSYLLADGVAQPWSNKKMFTNGANAYAVAGFEITDNAGGYPNGKYALVCLSSNPVNINDLPNIECNGKFILVNLDKGYYFNPADSSQSLNYIEEIDVAGHFCIYTKQDTQWKWVCPEIDSDTNIPKIDNWLILP